MSGLILTPNAFFVKLSKLTFIISFSMSINYHQYTQQKLCRYKPDPVVGYLHETSDTIARFCQSVH